MKDVKIQDNFLEQNYFNKLIKISGGEFCPYFIQNHVNSVDDNHFQMTHTIYTDWAPRSDLYGELGPIFQKLNMFTLLRCKINLLPRTDKVIEHGFHIDISDGFDRCKTAVMYLNTNNGYTLFEDGTKVESVANRLVTFNNSTKHSGSTNTCDEPYRLVLNMDYI